MDKIKISLNGKNYSVNSNLRLKDLIDKYHIDKKYPILVARVNNVLHELNDPVEENSTIEFLDCTSRAGNRIYQKGLAFLLVCAVKDALGEDKEIKISHAIDKGVYVVPNFEVTEDILKQITAKMNELVKLDIPIEKVSVKRLDAIEYYNALGYSDKAKSLLYNTNTFVNLYRIDKHYNYFYSKLPISTKVFTKFKLQYIDEKGFVIQTPVSYLDGKVTDYVHHEKMFEAFREYKEWISMIKVENISDLNYSVIKGQIKDLIRMSEVVYNNQLLYLARRIYDERDRIKMVLLAGPSSSGKTTTARKLSLYFKGFGLNPKVISLDDYFKEREESPKREDGKYDFESIEAIDLELFNNHMSKLLAGEEIIMPTFNFVTGKKEYDKEMKLEENDIIIIEGLHCLNERLTSSIAKENKFKIYVSPLTELNIDRHNRVSSSDNRLLRRLARDYRTRGYTPEQILDAWSNVRMGEEKYVFPFQDEADYIVNTANIYEIAVLKTYVEPLLYNVSPNSKYYEDAKRLLDLLRLFLAIPDKYVPDDAILREFIGDGYYHD